MSEVYIYPFPGAVFSSKEQFDHYRKSHSHLLDYRYSYELKLASTENIVQTGICPITLRPARFVSKLDDGEKLPSGKFLPNWRKEQVDEGGVRMPDRALGHYALYSSVEGELGRVLVLSETDALARTLKPFSTSVAQKNFDTLGKLKESYDTIFVANLLEQHRAFLTNLEKLNTLLAPGGKIYFHINFHYFDESSKMTEHANGVYWATGWDVIENLANTGFDSPQAITFWSSEIGYLGAFNFIFEASKSWAP